MNRVIVMTVNNHPKYFNQIKAAVMSLAINAPDEKVVAHLVDFDELPDLSKINPNCTTVGRTLNLDKVAANKRSGFMSCLRSKIVLEALQDGHDAVAYFDSDILVRDSLDSLWNGVEPDTLKVVTRPDEPDDARIQCGVFILGTSPETLTMMTEYDGIIQKENVFLREQEELFLIRQRHKEAVRLVELDGKYNEWKFKPNSVIWHCKGNHFTDRKFQTEWKEYLRKADALIY